MVVWVPRGCQGVCSVAIYYGDNVKWLIPFPGDWHAMYNYHKVLMKLYADDLAKDSGYRSKTLTALRNATRTHLFLLQSFEPLYHFMPLFLFSLKPAS